MPEQMTPQERFEHRVKLILTEPKTEPRFKLWQRIKYCLSDGIKVGCVVGYYWSSVAYAFQNGEEPGWTYTIEEDWSHRIVDEQLLIEGVEAVSETLG
jgi:hypothetical protein